MKAAILSIGSEVALGRIADTNAAWLSRRLIELGCEVARHTAVPDERGEILRALACVAEGADAVVITGGLGPTQDDMTRELVAEHCGVGLAEHAAAGEHLRAFFRRIGRPMSPSNMRQAMLPDGARALPNPRGTAFGFAVSCNGADFYALPGVPAEMRAMFEAEVAPALAAKASSGIALRQLRVFGAGESTVGELLGDLMRRGANPDVGTQVEQGAITVRVLARAETREEAQALADATAEEAMRRLGDDLVFGEGEEEIEEAVARLMERSGLTLAAAESCTGGLVSSLLTDVPGASQWFLEGVVAYSNQCKVSRLGVPEGLIAEKGAVSPEVAEAMVAGMRGRSGADVAVALTGIAGPGGAVPGKPVGLVYVAVADAQGVSVERFQCSGQRTDVKRRAARHALNMVRLRVKRRLAEAG